MTIRVRRLVCDIIVSLPGAAAERSPEATQAAVRFQRAIDRDVPSPSTVPAEGSSERPPAEREVAESPGVDPRVLADRVFRLMKEDLAIARERTGLGGRS